MASMNGKPGDQKYLSDRTERFWSYRKIPSLKEYVLITHNGQTMIETYNRSSDQSWRYQVYTRSENDSVNFETFDIKLPVTDFYL